MDWDDISIGIFHGTKVAWEGRSSVVVGHYRLAASRETFEPNNGIKWVYEINHLDSPRQTI